MNTDRSPGGGRTIPRLAGFDHSAAFLADPYRFISRACARAGHDVVQARLLLQPTLCLVGAEAARLFYDKERFTRTGAAPEAVQATLFGKGGVQTLDGGEHLARKRLFLHATTTQSVQQLLAQVEQAWRFAAARWPRDQPFALYDALHGVLTRAACAWAGVPLAEHEAGKRTLQLVALFDQAASGAAAHLRSRRARHRAERWLAEMIAASRSGGEVFPRESIAWEAAHWRGADGEPLPARIAAVELLNLLRPVVAVSVYLVLGAHALHLHPQWKEPLARGHGPVARAFTQEVRRFYPFFPAVTARTTRDFVWKGFGFPAGVRTLLDLYGTNHDERSWDAPEQFRPERFMERVPGPFAFVPQGGARADDHHRCPGEEVTLGVMQLGLRLLAAGDYAVPHQDLRVRMERMPALPASGFLLVPF